MIWQELIRKYQILQSSSESHCFRKFIKSEPTFPKWHSASYCFLSQSLLSNLTYFNIFLGTTREMISPSNLQEKPWCGPTFPQQQLEHVRKENTSAATSWIWISWNISTSNLHAFLAPSTGCWTWKVARVSSSTLDVDGCFFVYTNKQGGEGTEKNRWRGWNNTSGWESEISL